MEAKDKQRFAKPYMRLVITAGIAACFLSIYRLSVLSFAQIDLGVLLLAAMTLVIGSRISVRIPRLTAQITVSDTLIFLTMLLYGGEAAVLLTAAEGLCSSLRFSKKPITILFNLGVMACSTFLSVWTLSLSFGLITDLPRNSYSAIFIIALCALALIPDVWTHLKK